MFKLMAMAACAASSLVGMGASFVLGYGCGACARRETETEPARCPRASVLHGELREEPLHSPRVELAVGIAVRFRLDTYSVRSGQKLNASHSAIVPYAPPTVPTAHPQYPNPSIGSEVGE